MGDRQNVLVWHSGHRNDMVYIEGLRLAFEELGCEVIAVCADDASTATTAMRAVVQQPDEFLCMISVSYYGLNLNYGDRPLEQCTPVPMVMWLLDTPALFRNHEKDNLPREPRNVIVASNCASHIDYWHRHVCADTPAVETNWGVGAHPLLPQREFDLESYLARRPIALLPLNFIHFNMNLDSCAARIASLPPIYAKIVGEAVEMAAREILLPPFEALEKAALARSVEINPAHFGTLAMLADCYVKLWRRHFVMAQLLDLPVRFLGNGYPEFWQFDRRKRFADIHMPEIIEEFRTARFVISIGPAFPRLVHERVLQSMGAGAAVMTERQPGIAELFTDGEDIVNFDLSDGDAAEKLMTWLDRPEESYALAESARRKLYGRDVYAENASRIYDIVTRLRDEPWRAAS